MCVCYVCVCFYIASISVALFRPSSPVGLTVTYSMQNVWQGADAMSVSVLVPVHKTYCSFRTDLQDSFPQFGTSLFLRLHYRAFFIT